MWWKCKIKTTLSFAVNRAYHFWLEKVKSWPLLDYENTHLTISTNLFIETFLTHQSVFEYHVWPMLFACCGWLSVCLHVSITCSKHTVKMFLENLAIFSPGDSGMLKSVTPAKLEMTSKTGNNAWWRHQMEKFFRVTGHLCGELWCFLWSASD